MKMKNLSGITTLLALLAAPPHCSLAVGGNWTNDTSSIWRAATKWNPNVVRGTVVGTW